MNRIKHARILFAASMIIFGTLGPFVRNISVSSAELALYRAVLAVVLIFVYFLAAKRKLSFRGIQKEAILLLLSGAAMGINWILLFEAYRYTTVSAATLSYYFAPVIVTAACPVLFGERLTARQILCFFMSAAGLVLITGTGNAAGNAGHITGILFGLGAAVFYASVVLLNKCIKTAEGIVRAFLQFLAAIAVLFPYVAFAEGFHLGELSPAGWSSLLIVGCFHTGIAYCMYFSSLKDLPGQKAAILSYLDPLTAVMVSVLVLGERMTPVQFAGGALILGFTLWNELGDKGWKK